MEIKNSIMGLVRRASYVLTLHCTGRTLESLLDCKKINPVNPKGNQSWIFIGRTDAEVETPILWPPIRKSWLIGKDPDAGKDWRQEEKGMTEDEMVGWHHQLNGHEFEQAAGDGEVQRSLVCCSTWGYKELDMIQRLKNNKCDQCHDLSFFFFFLIFSWLFHSPLSLSSRGSLFHLSFLP